MRLASKGEITLENHILFFYISSRGHSKNRWNPRRYWLAANELTVKPDTSDSSFIIFLNKINSDRAITPAEINELVEWGSQLSLLCRPYVITVIHEYAFQQIAFGVSSYSELTAEQKKNWKAWMTRSYGKSADFEEEADCELEFGGVAEIISYLRDDMTCKEVSDEEENIDVHETLQELLELHSATGIKFDEDGDFVIIKGDEKPKQRNARTKKKSPVSTNG